MGGPTTCKLWCQALAADTQKLAAYGATHSAVKFIKCLGPWPWLAALLIVFVSWMLHKILYACTVIRKNFR